MFNDLNDVRLFAVVARQGAVTRGAEALGMPAATVSRRLAALEQEVGTRLIERSARHFELTETGRAYFAAANRLMEDLESASAEVSGLVARASGHVRMAAPPDFATAFLAQPIARFLAQHPDITVSMDLSPRRVDLIDDGFDLALRLGRLEDSRLVSRRLTTLRRGFFASPAFAAQHRLPLQPADLQGTRMVSLEAYAQYGRLRLTRLDGRSDDHEVDVAGHVTVNSMTMLRQLLIAGAGIGLVPERLLAEELAANRVVRVLPQWEAPALDAHVLVRTRQLLPLRVRLLLDHLVAAFAENDIG